MRALRFHEYGDPTVLVLDDVPEPHAGPGQVRISVRATSVNPRDWKVRAGLLAKMRPSTFPAFTGSDAAGTVDEVGEGVAGVQVGDEVFGLAAGAAAEQAVLTAWAPVPSTWTTEQAGAAGLAATTAVAGLNALGDIAGKTVLVEGAAGGVGSAAVQVAIARGATVVGTASEANHDFLRALGALPTTYGPNLAERVAALAPGGVDAALDTAGSGSLADLVVLVGDPSKVATIADFGAAALGASMVAGTANAATDLAEVARLGQDGALVVHVQATFPLEQGGAAQALVQGGHTRGKVVITL